jgi:hypothetical protein
MPRKVNYFEAKRQYASSMETVLCDIPAKVIPTALSSLETRKNRSFWVDEDAFSRAYQEITRTQWELLMDASEKIIIELRHLRGSYDTDDLSLETWPVGTFPGLQLETINNSLYNTDGKGVGILLGEIRDILATQGQGEQGQLDALNAIVALLSA